MKLQSATGWKIWFIAKDQARLIALPYGELGKTIYIYVEYNHYPYTLLSQEIHSSQMAFHREHTYQFPRYHLIHIAEWEYDAKHFIRTMRPNLWYYISASSHDILPINNDYLEARRFLLDCVPTKLRAALENLVFVPRMWRFLTRTFRFMTENRGLHI